MERHRGRSVGPATVLGTGTAVPANVYEQSEYPDFFFNITGCDQKSELKEKFRRICQKTGIQRRYMHLSKEMLQKRPELCSYLGASLNERQEIVVREVPKLAAEASLKAIKDWGGSKYQITHVVMATTSGVNMPGADVHLIKLLGLHPHTKRIMMYQQGCYAGATVVRVAKDLAENNAGARVLAVASELTVITFRAPSTEHLDGLVGSALFGDGAAAVVIGSDPVAEKEKKVFEVVWSGETLLPDSDGAIEGKLTEAGLIFHLMRDVPSIISRNIQKFLTFAISQAGISPTPTWDDMFWVVHPGGPAILEGMEEKLLLGPHKLDCTRQILADFGNMSSCSVLFALHEMHSRSKSMSCLTTGEGCVWGALVGFGPGLTLELSLLKSCPL